MSNNKNKKGEEIEEVIRVRIVKKENGEVLGIVEKLLGANRMMVQCIDSVKRMCRIPGKLKKKRWISIGDVVIVVPWEFQDEKGDIVHKYTRAQAAWLKKKGYM